MQTDSGITVDSVILSAIGLFLLYMLWYQYAFSPNGLVMPVCALILGAYLFFHIQTIAFFKYLLPVIGFFGICFLSLLQSDVFSRGMALLVNMLKYSIPMVAIYVFVGYDGKKLGKILWITSLAGILLAISTMTKGHTTSTGAVTLKDLNPNVLSTYLMLGLISELLLMLRETSVRRKIVLTLFILVEGAGQIVVASRRGVLVFLFLCVMYFFVSFTMLSNTQSRFFRIFLLELLVMLGIGIFAEEILENLDGLVVVQRLLGTSSGGDKKREQYQTVAWKLFLSSPIFGKGLGAVSKYAGMYSHSLYYETLACTGLAGFSCIGLFFGNICVNLFRLKKGIRNPRYAAQIVMTAWSIAAILISAIAVVLIYDSVFYILLGILGACIHVFERERGRGYRR